MAKKKKKRKPKKLTTTAKQTKPQPNKRTQFRLPVLIAGGILILIGVYMLYQGEKQTQGIPEISKFKKENINLRENRPTLSPQKFSGTVRIAYEIAHTIPEVLDQLYCYCRCQENFGHKNLLSCYVDTHAST